MGNPGTKRFLHSSPVDLDFDSLGSQWTTGVDQRATIGHCRASSYLGVVKVDKSNDWTLIKARCSEEEDQQRRCRVCHCEEEDQQRHAVTVLDRR
ncbi:hypothetical protein MRB53_034719 [Persea americana]|uniref:Uncharacterized protein n=1 Tax=Persea americana TaxID=3435 RepID=A0ACC2K333_PERAE|nr:hypothetical protein MRB53_034719 [Persea americana]